MDQSDIISGEYAKNKLVPWLTPAAMKVLEPLIKPDWTVFEWGSGGSSIWLAQRCKAVTTVEYQRAWYDWLVETAERLELANLTTLYRNQQSREYVHVIDWLEHPPFDMVLVDGRHRMQCIQQAHSRMKPGGVLLLDNSERERYEIPEPVKDWPTTVVECDPEIGLAWQAKFFFKPVYQEEG